MTKITVRTVSDLPEITKQSDVLSTALIPVSVESQAQVAGYISKKITYGTLIKKVISDVSSFNERTYDLTGGMSISSDFKKLNDIISSEATFTGDVEFENIPTINGEEIATKKDVQEIIDNDSGVFITPFSKKVQNINSIIAKISNNQESSHCVKITNKGMLTLYGSISDTGVVAPAEAWVALKGCITNAVGNPEWTILQVQPWIIGEKSKQLQYVSFSIPVYTGLSVTVETGFQLSEQNSGAQNTNRSLNIDGAPNEFKGYVIGI